MVHERLMLGSPMPVSALGRLPAAGMARRHAEADLRSHGMKKWVVLFGLGIIAGSLSAGCGDDESLCDKVEAKLDECGADAMGNMCKDDASEEEECAANCVVDASCDDLASVDFSNPFFTCLANCGVTMQ